MNRFILSCCLLVLLSVGASLPVDAAVTRQQAASIAQSRFEGRVIAVSEETSGGNLIYKVKVLDKSGGMHIVIIDANSGQIISAH